MFEWGVCVSMCRCVVCYVVDGKEVYMGVMVQSGGVTNRKMVRVLKK